MGNNESYRQVSTSADNEDTQDDLTFVFHTTDEDSVDRVVHDSESVSESLPYTVTSNSRLIAERKDFSEPINHSEFFCHVRPGDAIEFVKQGKRFHWAIYIGEGLLIHLKHGGIVTAHSQDICKDRKCRLANNIYKFPPLPTVQIINNAQTQVGMPLIWSNSECFVMWCRTGRSEFTNEEMQIQNLDSMSPKTTKHKYLLEITDTSGMFINQRFSTLSDLTQWRRNLEKFGNGKQ